MLLLLAESFFKPYKINKNCAQKKVKINILKGNSNNNVIMQLPNRGREENACYLLPYRVGLTFFFSCGINVCYLFIF